MHSSNNNSNILHKINETHETIMQENPNDTKAHESKSRVQGP